MADKVILTYQANTDQFNKDIKKATQNVNQLDKATEDVNKTTKSTFDSDGVKKYNTEVGKSSKGVSGLLGNLGKMAPVIGAAFAVGQIASFVNELAVAGRQVLKLQKGLKQLQGVGEGNLDQLTAQVQSLASVFGESEEDILRAANALSKTFGIDGAEALKQIERGFLSAANQNGDLLESLKEYSVQIKDAGLGVDQFVSILNQSGQEGIFSDKGVDVIKEFGLRIREQSKATSDALTDAFGKKFTDDLFEGLNKGALTSAQALEQVSKKLKESQIPAKQLQTVVADVFGGPGEDVGLEFLKTLTDITAENKNIVDEADAYTLEQQRQLEAQQKFNELVNDLKLLAVQVVGFLRDSVLEYTKLLGLDNLKNQITTIKQYNQAIEERNKLFKQDQEAFKGQNKEINDVTANLVRLKEEGKITNEEFLQAGTALLQQKNQEAAAQIKVNQEFDKLLTQNSKYKEDIEAVIAGYGKTEEGLKVAKEILGGIAFEEKKRADELKKQQAAQKKAAEEAKKAAEQREKQIQRELEQLRERAELLALGEEGTIERVEALRDREIQKLQESNAFKRLLAEEQALIITDIEKKAAEDIQAINDAKEKEELDTLNRRKQAIIEFQKIQAGDNIDDQIAALENERDFLLENEELLNEEKLLIEAQFQEQIKSLRDTAREEEIASQQALAQAERELFDARLQGAKDLVGALSSLVDENTALGKGLFLLDKALAIGEIIVNLQREISSIAATNAVLGPAGVPLTAAQTTAAKIRAATSIATVVATTIQGFKDGVIDLDGPGTGTSDSITAKLSKGESVMTAKETRKYKDVLQAMRDNEFEDFVLDKYIAPYLNEQLDGITKLKAGLDAPKIDNKLTNGLLRQLVKGQNKATELGMDTISKLNGSNRRSFY